MPLGATWCRLMHLDKTCNLLFVSRMLRSLHYLSCGWVGGLVAEPMCWLGQLRSLCVGWVGVDTEINARPAQAEVRVGAGAELGNT